MQYRINDTEDHTLGEINDYLVSELKKTSLIKEEIVIDDTLKVKIAMMELQRIFDENEMGEFVSFDLDGMTLNHTQNLIEFSENELNSRFDDAFQSILEGISQEVKDEYEFCSSHGDLRIDAKGNVLNDPDELEDWLCTIKKVDVDELMRYNRAMDFGDCLTDGDVLDFGFWDKEGKYHKPDEKWRHETYHNKNLDERVREQIINYSIIWINRHR